MLDSIFAKLGLEFRVPANLFLGSVADQYLGCSVVLYKPLYGFVCISLLLYLICSFEEFFVGEYLTVSFSVY